MILSKERND